MTTSTNAAPLLRGLLADLRKIALTWELAVSDEDGWIVCGDRVLAELERAERAMESALEEGVTFEP